MASSVGLFVDYENIYISLARQFPRVHRHDLLVHRLVELASTFGDANFRVIWADWDRFPGAQRLCATARFDTRFVPTTSSGKNSADMAMQAEILKLLARDEAPQVFVIATGDRDFLFTVDELKRQGRRVILLGVEQTTSQELRLAAHQFIALEPPRDPSQAQPSSSGHASEPGTEAGSAPSTARKSGTERPLSLPLPLLVQLQAALEELLLARDLPWSSFRLLASHLVERHLATEETVHQIIDQAVESGYLVREEDRSGPKRFYRFVSPRPRLKPRRELDSARSLPSGGAPLRRAMPQNSTQMIQNVSIQGVHPPGDASRTLSPPPSAHGEPGRSTESLEPPQPARSFAPRGSGWGQDWRNFTFVQIVWALHALIEDQPSRYFINPSSLLDALRKEGIGYTEEEVFFWVNQSVDRGILLREVKELPGIPPQRFYRYYLHHQSRLVVLALEVPRAIVQTLDSVLSKRSDWKGIAFSFVMKLLQVHPFLSNPAWDLSANRLREWLNFLIDEQLLQKFEEPDLKDPSRSTTMLELNREHPHTLRFLRRESHDHYKTPEHQASLRVILTIDHFLHWLHLKSPDEHWLPLMTLKTWLRAMMGDQLTKWAIQVCEKEGIFRIERFQNKGTSEQSVAGVVLETAHPLVARTLEQRDEFLRGVIGLLRNRVTVPAVLLEQRLREDERFGATPEERLGWIGLMLDNKVMMIERDALGGTDAHPSFVARLNTREKFVGELLNRVLRTSHSPIKRHTMPVGLESPGGSSSLFQDEPDAISSDEPEG